MMLMVIPGSAAFTDWRCAGQGGSKLGLVMSCQGTAVIVGGSIILSEAPLDTTPLLES